MRGIPATAVAVFLAALAISSTALAVAPTYTLRVRTGIAPVDLVLGRLESNDAGSLVASIVYRRLPCTRKSDPLLPRPRCLPGEPTGKLVKVVPAGTHGCSGGYRRLEDMAAIVDAWLGIRARPYAIYRTNRRDFLYRPGDFGLIFAYERPGASRSLTASLHVTPEGRLRSIVVVHCGDTPAEIWSHTTGTVVLGPRKR